MRAYPFITVSPRLLSVVDSFGIHIVAREPIPGYLFPLSPLFTVVAIWINGNSAAGQKFAPYFDICRVHQINKVVHNYVNAVFVKVAAVSESKEIQLQGLAFNHLFTRYVRNVDRGKIGLPRNGTKACKFGTVELNEVVPTDVLICKRLQDGRVVSLRIFRIAVSKQGNSFVMLFS